MAMGSITVHMHLQGTTFAMVARELFWSYPRTALGLADGDRVVHVERRVL